MHHAFENLTIHKTTKDKLRRLARILTRKRPDKKKVKLWEATETAIGDALEKHKPRKKKK